MKDDRVLTGPGGSSFYPGLIVGLGNPGSRYTDTRHNMGQIFLEHLRLRIQAPPMVRHKATGANLIQCELPYKTTLATLSSFMNGSGEPIEILLRWLNLTASALLVVHDDLGLKSGETRLKFGGGHGGHNGLRSLIDRLKTGDFWRLRLGIGRPLSKLKNEVSHYVLSAPPEDEREKILQGFALYIQYILNWCAGVIVPSTTQINLRPDFSDTGP